MGKAVIFNGVNARLIPGGNLLASDGTVYARGLSSVVVSATGTAVNFTKCLVNTSGGAITLTLPAGSAGAVIEFDDSTRSWATNNLTITPNGSQQISGLTAGSSLVCNISGAFVRLTWDSTNNWWVVSGSGFQTLSTYSPGVTAGILPSGGVPGVSTGTVIGSGFVGQVITSGQIGNSVGLGTTPSNLGSISVPQGNWIIFAMLTFSGPAGTTYVQGAISTTSASLSGTSLGVNSLIAANASTQGEGSAITIIESVQPISTTTYYFVAQASNAPGTGVVLGSMTAVRIS